jgi:glycolate oxidase FAD binding subunit
VVTAASIAIDGVQASSRAAPDSADAVASLLHEAGQRGQKVAPVGGGTQLDLGNPPARVDVALETDRLNRVVEYEPADLTVTVEAGMRFADLQKLLGEQGQFLALDPPLADAASIGGVIATNASGPLRFSSGTARDLVIGCRVANVDGTVTHSGGRVVKNVAGYDLNKLYIGSLGTLGVIVELSFKLAPLPPASACVVGAFSSAGASADVLRAAVRSPLAPLAIELLSPAFAASAGLASQWTVIFRAGGYPEAVARQVRDFSSLIASHGGRASDAPQAVWEALARARVDAQRRDVVVKAAAPISASSRLAELLESRLAGSAWAHAGNGVAYCATDSASADTLVELRRAVQVFGDNASLVIQRCPVALKQSLDVWGDPGPSLALMRALKSKLDPNNTLNPGRYVGRI